MRTNLAIAVCMGLAMSGWASAASAHHAFAAEFDANRPVNFKGTITKMEWVNPHTWLHVDVKNSDGTVENWAIEAGTPNVLFRRGFTKESLLPGTEIMIDGYQSKDGTHRANGRDLTFPDGRKLSSAIVITPDIGMPVTKFGSVTGRTEGTIDDVSVDLYVDYAFGTFLLENQVMIRGTNDPNFFATAGDSGSLVVHQQESQALGMICAASGLFAVACPLENVLDRLKDGAKLPKLELALD